MKPEELERTKLDLERCLGRVASRLIANKEYPYTLKGLMIESHGTTRKKTLRLLRESGHLKQVSYSRSTANQEFNFQNDFDQMASGLAEEPQIPEVPSEVAKAMNSNQVYNQLSSTLDSVDKLGFIELGMLTPREKMYVWFHLNDFIANKRSYTDKIIVFPRKMLDKRKIHTTRGLFKKYSSEKLMPWLSQKFGYHPDSLLGFDAHTKFEDPIVEETIHTHKNATLKLRNATRFPVTFNEECFDAHLKGYHDEYAMRLGWLRMKHDLLLSLQKDVVDYGYEKLMTEFIEYAKGEILAEAPVMVIDEEESGAGMMLLENIHLITFENIFGENRDEQPKPRQSQTA